MLQRRLSYDEPTEMDDENWIDKISYCRRAHLIRTHVGALTYKAAYTRQFGQSIISTCHLHGGPTIYIPIRAQAKQTQTYLQYCNLWSIASSFNVAWQIYWEFAEQTIGFRLVTTEVATFPSSSSPQANISDCIIVRVLDRQPFLMPHWVWDASVELCDNILKFFSTPFALQILNISCCSPCFCQGQNIGGRTFATFHLGFRYI